MIIANSGKNCHCLGAWRKKKAWTVDKVTKMNTTIIIKDKMNNLLLDFPSWFSHGECCLSQMVFWLPRCFQQLYIYNMYLRCAIDLF